MSSSILPFGFRPDYAMQRMPASKRNADEQITSAERRICRVHDWLLQALKDGRVAASAEEWIVPTEGAEPVRVSSRDSVDPTKWVGVEVDYAAQEARSRSDEVSDRLGFEIVGQLVLFDMRLTSSDIAKEVHTLARPTHPPELTLSVGPSGSDVCEIVWDGTRFPIDLENGRQAINRTMRALAVVLRNPNRPVAYHLLAGLVRRNSNTGRQAPDVRELAVKLRQKTDPIGLDLYHGRISLDDAHEALDKILSADEQEGPSLRAWAVWSAGYGDKTSRGSKKASRAYDTVRSNVRDSFKEGLAAIKAAGAVDATSFLGKWIKRELHAVRFDESATGLAWIVRPFVPAGDATKSSG